MRGYTKDDCRQAINVIDSKVMQCEKIQPKFAVGSSQYTLLKNRIKALHISKALILNDERMEEHYTRDDVEHSLPPIESIIHKCKQAQEKHKIDSVYYMRLEKIIVAMKIARENIIRYLDE